MSRIRRRSIALVAPFIAVALLATSCSSSPSSRSAGGASGNPVELAALPGSASGVGDVAPVYEGAVVTPERGVSTSLSPTISLPGAAGAWEFRITDLSDGRSGFVRTYSATGSSVRVPVGAGLQQGRAYAWKATSKTDPNDVRGGTFVVNLQQFDVQKVDALGGFNVGLSSGEGFVNWSSHTLDSVGGPVGFGLSFAGSNVAQAGVPAGWKLDATSGAQFTRLEVRDDGSVGLVSSNGSYSNYVQAGGEWRPVRLSGVFQITGAAPVLAQNTDGTWSVIAKQSTSVFGVPDDSGVAYLEGVSASGRPVLAQSWSDGRVQAVTDPVSGRQVTFGYAGDKGVNCPNPMSGFVAAPAGMICQVSFWDGTTTAITYVDTAAGSPSIGRIADVPEAAGDGAAVTDFAYDSVGRIIATRSPIVAGAQAAQVIDANDPQFLTSVTYTEGATVASITEPAPAPGVARRTHSYDYQSRNTTEIIDSLFGGPIESVRFDPGSFLVLSDTDTTGIPVTNEWDYSTGNLLKATDRNGNVTVSEYANGQLVRTVGPTEGSLATDGAAFTYQYDQSFEQNPDGSAMRGLDVTYWPNANWTGLDDRTELGPRLDGTLVPSLTVNWPSSPTDSEQWSARMTGVFTVNTEGDYSIVPGGAARVWVDNISCSTLGGLDTTPQMPDRLASVPDLSSNMAAKVVGCNGLPLRPGLHSIRIDVSSNEGPASMSVEWSGPDTGGVKTSMPTSVVGPRYGFQTTTKQRDAVATGVAAETISHSVFDEPGTGQPSSRVTQAGAVSTARYQASTGSNGQWGRQEYTGLPGGNGYRFVYWGDKEKAKSSCPKASSAVQGGQVKSSIAPSPSGTGDGPTSMNWYDDAGRVVATQFAGGATTCTTYDKTGRPVVVEQLGMGSTHRLTTEYSIDGNPLSVQSTSVIGDSTTTEKMTIDLLGRTVASTDRFGVTTSTVWDQRTGKIASTTVVAPGAAPIVTSYVYNAVGQLQSQTSAGLTSTLTYNPDTTLASVTYGDTATLVLGYDDSNRVNSREWTTKAGGRFASSIVTSPSGRITGAAWNSGGRTSTAAYTYDDARRLSTANISNGIVQAQSWGYTYDKNSNRLSKTTDGTTLSYTYNAADQIVSSDDPALAGGVTYDARGNATKLGADSFTYDAVDNLISATDGTTTVDFSRAIDGSIISRTEKGANSSATVGFAAGGIVVDGDGRAVMANIALPGGVGLAHQMNGIADTLRLNDLFGSNFVTLSLAGAQVGTTQMYDPFGMPLTPADPVPSSEPALGWQGSTGNETIDLATPIVMMGSRVYVPTLGRFIQLDPKVGGSANGYDFASQDPINVSDPSGQTWIDILVGVITVVASVALAYATGGASIGWSIVAGVVQGAVIGAVGYYATYLFNNLAGYDRQWSTETLLWEVGIGALLGAIGGGIGSKVTRVRNARAAEQNALQVSAKQQAAKIEAQEFKATMSRLKAQQLENRQAAYAARNIENQSFADRVALELYEADNPLALIEVRKGQFGFYMPQSGY